MKSRIRKITAGMLALVTSTFLCVPAYAAEKKLTASDIANVVHEGDVFLTARYIQTLIRSLTRCSRTKINVFPS